MALQADAYTDLRRSPSGAPTGVLLEPRQALQWTVVLSLGCAVKFWKWVCINSFFINTLSANQDYSAG